MAEEAIKLQIDGGIELKKLLFYYLAAQQAFFFVVKKAFEFFHDLLQL